MVGRDYYNTVNEAEEVVVWKMWQRRVLCTGVKPPHESDQEAELVGRPREQLYVGEHPSSFIEGASAPTGYY